MNKTRLLTIILISFTSFHGICQGNSVFNIPDSLKLNTYDQLIMKFDSQLDKDNDVARIYANTYFQKSKNDNNILKTAIGYSLVAYTYKNIEYRLQYLDSAIAYASRIKHKQYPTVFYLNKGGALEETGQFQKALDYYVIAIESARKQKNQQLESITKHIIGFLKRRLGKYEEAKKMFKSCLFYEANKKDMLPKDSLSYLITLSELVHTYRLTKQIDSASIFNKEGLVSSKSKDIFHLFKLNEAILYYYQGDYDKVIEGGNKILQKSLPLENKYKIKTLDLTNLYVYQAKSHKALKNKPEEIRCYKKIDSLLHISNYIIPEIRTVYNNLINYYRTTGDKNLQLFYIDKLLKADSILDRDYKYINDKLVRDYDTPQLMLQKETLIKSLKTNKSDLFTMLIALVVILSISMVTLFFFYKRNKIYQKRFKELITAEKVIEKNQPSNHSDSIDVPRDVVDTILENLTRFEKKNGYTKINLTLKELANKCKTNSKYLSKVINTYKGKSFIYYINDLRIDFIIETLKHNVKYRAYTIKALATESGFNTTDAFSKSFYRNTGIYPSYFIKQLTKEQNKVKEL